MTQGLREMVVESVRVHMLSSQHVVILREAENERYLPIWIGSWEAQSIAMKLQGVEALVTTERVRAEVLAGSPHAVLRQARWCLKS